VKPRHRNLLIGTIILSIVLVIVPNSVGWIAPDKIKWYELLSLLISIAGIVGVVFSLLMISKSNEFDTMNRFYDRQVELDKVFVDHPEMWPYFYENCDVTHTNEDYNRAAAMSELMLDIFEDIILVDSAEKMISKSHKFVMESDPGTPIQWDVNGTIYAYMMDTIYGSPILIQRLLARKYRDDHALVMLMEMAPRHKLNRGDVHV